MPDVKEVINGLEMSYKYSNVDENNTLVPQWIVLHALALLKAQEPVDAVPVVHGKWHEYHATARGYGKVYYQHSCTPILYESPYYYCPNCGAKMDSERRASE